MKNNDTKGLIVGMLAAGVLLVVLSLTGCKTGEACPTCGTKTWGAGWTLGGSKCAGCGRPN